MALTCKISMVFPEAGYLVPDSQTLFGSTRESICASIGTLNATKRDIIQIIEF